MQTAAACGRSKSFGCYVAELFAILLAAAVVQLPASAQTTTASAASPPTAGQKFKNIQVLKDIPADQLIPSMEFITGSLGVGCDFCHVEHHFDKDDKKEKKTARKMMQMMSAINQNNFEGEREVTCNTCHRGSPHPEATPGITAEGPKPQPAAAAHQMNPADLPSGDPFMARYLQALGGQAALAKVTTRVETGKALMTEGPPIPISIYTEAPDKRVSVLHTPKGDSVTAYNGQGGWLWFPGRPPREMSLADQVAARLDAEAFYPNLLQQQFSELKLKGTSEKVGTQDADLVVGLAQGQPPVKFYFDKGSGLLVRMVHYTDSALGLNPTQVDFADYRSIAGVQTPYRWTIARPSGAFSIQIDDVQQNVLIDAARFQEPKPPPPTPPPSPVSPPAPSAPGTTPQGPRPPQQSVPSPGGMQAPAPGTM